MSSLSSSRTKGQLHWGHKALGITALNLELNQKQSHCEIFSVKHSLDNEQHQFHGHISQYINIIGLMKFANNARGPFVAMHEQAVLGF